MRAPALGSFQSRYSPADKRNLNSFRWPNVFLMQPCDLCCCQSVGLTGTPGCEWAGGRGPGKVAKINRSGRGITHPIRSVLHYRGRIPGRSARPSRTMNELRLPKRTFDETIQINPRKLFMRLMRRVGGFISHRGADLL